MKVAKIIKPCIMSIAVIAAGIVMLRLRFSGVMLFDQQDMTWFNHETSYQLSTLVIFILLAILSLVLSGKQVLSFLNLKSLSGPVTEVPWMGLTVKEGQDWKHVGASFLVVISGVTALTVFFQVMQGGTFTFSFTRVLLPAVIFAAANSFLEEGIFRYAIVSVFESSKVPPVVTAIISGLIFGAVHYFGTPGGIPGVILAGFLGWILAKSIIETRSFSWAWIIHAAQDVIIFTALFGTSQS